MRKYYNLCSLILSVCFLMLCGCKSGSGINSEPLSSYYGAQSAAAVEEQTGNTSSDTSVRESVDSTVETNEDESNEDKLTVSAFKIPGAEGYNNIESGSAASSASGNQNRKENETEKLKYVALTFDDGPNTDNTYMLLDKLKQYNIPATFMLKGSNISEKTEEVMKRIVSENCEIGNHSFEHTESLYTSGAEHILEDYNKTEELIKKYAGVSSAFYRPPFIKVNDVLRNTIPVPLISGTGCNDWDGSVTAEQRAETIISSISDGGIILLHDTSGNTKTVDALDLIIPALKDKGYTFVTVTELFKKCNVTASKGELYKSAYQTIKGNG